jgi:hypothetical protein
MYANAIVMPLKYSADIVAREVYAVDGEAGFRGGKKTKIVSLRCMKLGEIKEA